MYKIIGILLIMFSTGFMGFSKSNEFARRINYLKHMQSCVIQLENEIRYTQTPLKEVFLHLSDCSDTIIADIFKNAYNLACDSNGKSMNMIWDEVIFICKENFSKQDVPLMLSLGECLCNTDVEGQLKSIGLFSHNLKNATLYAEELYNKNKKLYRGLGIYSGAIISVLFL